VYKLLYLSMLDLSRKNLYLAALGFLASAEAFTVSSGPLFRAQSRAAVSLRNGAARQPALGLRMSNDPKV
jgi:hypothetical protein